MLLIAVGYGYSFNIEPFTESLFIKEEEIIFKELDCCDADQMCSLICNTKYLRPEWIDEIFIIYPSDASKEPKVLHHCMEDN